MAPYSLCSGLLVKNIDYHVFGGKQTTFGVKRNANMGDWSGGGRVRGHTWLVPAPAAEAATTLPQ